ncbi:predicted protein [Chaetoceros tenuissimus]|uniref:Uncharacterized protein n=1 Tax=Chaetoceros tenuissimus TaxID=426638 RepID=A0AAD3CZ73_9STRA|nr:predicted protein [Chaetoceros tenuissimus]
MDESGHNPIDDNFQTPPESPQWFHREKIDVLPESSSAEQSKYIMDALENEEKVEQDSQQESVAMEQHQRHDIPILPMPDVPPPPPPMTPSSVHEELQLENTEEAIEDDGLDQAAMTTLSPSNSLPIDSTKDTASASMIKNEEKLDQSSNIPVEKKKKKKTKSKKNKESIDEKGTKKTKRKKEIEKEGTKKTKKKSKKSKDLSSKEKYAKYRDEEYYYDSDGEDRPSVLSFCKPEPPPPPKSKKKKTKSTKAKSVKPKAKKKRKENEDWNRLPEQNKSKQNKNKSSFLANLPTPKIGRRVRMRLPGERINTGVLNSAAGEGTTIPQLLETMRYSTLVLCGVTICFESWAMFFNAILLKPDRVILGVYLLFFVGLLLIYEFVRGNPVPTVDHTAMLANAIPFLGNGNINSRDLNTEDVVGLVWTVVLQKRWVRRIRYFLQNNFGILYSCLGKGFYFCFVGTVAIGQKFIIIELVGIGFIVLGLWTITLSYRYPAIEKAMIVDLEREFGTMDGSSSRSHSNSISLSWTSVHSSINNGGDETTSLLNKV